MAAETVRNFIPMRIAVLTISDTRNSETDISGGLLIQLIEAAGHSVVFRDVVQDEVSAIEDRLRRWIAEPDLDVILSTGGTGITGRDVTPEAFARVLQKEIPGFGELFRMLSYAKIGSSAMLSRALGGVSDGKLLFALPGSPSAASQAWTEILIHQLDVRTEPGNLVRLLPRLRDK